MVFALLIGQVGQLAGQTDLHLEARDAGSNQLSIQLKSSEPSLHPVHRPPFELEVVIGDSLVRFSDPLSGEPLVVRISDDQVRMVALEELSLPTGAAGTYPMQVRAHRPGEEYRLDLTVRVGCSNARRTTYMECFLNCDRWEVHW